jgi:predicted RNase H-like nuclease (RuvC/YqgF family)
MDIVPEIFVSLVSLLSGYFFGRRKNDAETDRIVIQNVKEILEVYTNTIDALKEEVKDLKTKVMEYQKHIDKLQTELEEFRKDMVR